MFLKTSILLLVVYLTVTFVDCKSFYSFGGRVHGDRIILNKTVHSPTTSDEPANHTTTFQYSIEGTATYIELYSDHNVHADFSLAFDNFLEGKITAYGVLKFDITLVVYGLDIKDTPSDFRSILNKNTDLFGVLVDRGEYDYDLDFVRGDEEDYDNDDIDYIQFGARQPGDKVIHRHFESAVKTEQPSYHSVIFRYIDNQFLTSVRCRTYEVSNAKAIFTHVTEHSVKAEIYHPDTQYFDVECDIYGYEPKDKPEDYEPMPRGDSEPDALKLTGSSSKLSLPLNLLTVCFVVKRFFQTLVEM